MDLTNLVWQEFACPIQGVRANRVVQVRDVLQTIRASRMNVRWSAFQEAEGPLRVGFTRSRRPQCPVEVVEKPLF